MPNVSVIYLQPKKDGSKRGLDDYLAEGHTTAELLDLAVTELRRPPQADKQSNLPDDEGDETEFDPESSQATMLVSMAQEASDHLFHTAEKEAYADVRLGDHIETLRVRSRSYRLILAERFYRLVGKTPGSQSVQDALGVLEGKALFDGDERPVFVRLAHVEQDGQIGEVYLHLADREWRCVRITAEGWEVVSYDEVPVRFCLPRGMLTIPMPERGGSIEELRNFVNLPTPEFDDEWILLKAFLLACLFPKGPFPLLALTGEQGSGKSGQARTIRTQIDPNDAPLRHIAINSPSEHSGVGPGRGNRCCTCRQASSTMQYIQRVKSSKLVISLVWVIIRVVLRCLGFGIATAPLPHRRMYCQPFLSSITPYWAWCGGWRPVPSGCRAFRDGVAATARAR